MNVIIWVHILLGALLRPLFIISRRFQRLFSPQTKMIEFFGDRSAEVWNLSLSKAQRGLAENHYRDLRETKIKRIFWFHVASAGELEQAIPVARSLAEDHQSRFILSYMSPSAKPFVKNFPNLIFSFALNPFEVKNVQSVFENFQPAGLFFVRYDLWPLLIAIAHKRNCPLFLIGATSQLVRGGFVGLVGGAIKKKLLGYFSHVFAVSEGDRKKFSTFLGDNKVTLAGEPKWARAKERAENHSSKRSVITAVNGWIAPFKALTQSKVLVFGSPHKEELQIIKKLLSEKDSSNILIIAPHETSETAVTRFIETINASNVLIQRLSHLLENKLDLASPPLSVNLQNQDSEDARDLKTGQNLLELSAIAESRTQWMHSAKGKMIPGFEKNVLILDSVGLLAEIYSLGDVAIVGGGFDGGIHNCLEPAAHGVPVFFGSKHQRAPEARDLIEAKAAMAFETPEELFQFLKHCDTVSPVGSVFGQVENQLPRMALNSARLFECVPKTNQIIRTHVRKVLNI